jgi:hypothetical protein
MKDEKWFEDIALDLDDAVDDETALLNQDRTIEIIKRIYHQGRADQNEADVEAAIMCTEESDIGNAIRAAGPEVWYDEQ